jgi:hypothetical protein
VNEPGARVGDVDVANAVCCDARGTAELARTVTAGAPFAQELEGRFGRGRLLRGGAGAGREERENCENCNEAESGGLLHHTSKNLTQRHRDHRAH